MTRGPGFYLLVSLPATAMGFALSVQISVLSWLLATKYGLEIEDIGLVWAAGPLAGILGQVIVGGLSDRTWLWGGRRRVYVIAGGVLAAAAIALLPAIGAISTALGLDSVFGVAIAVALALDLAVNVGFNPTRALIADVTTEGDERTGAYSWMQVISGSFGVAAYAIGAVLGNMVLIQVAVALVLLFAVVPALMIAEPRSLSAEADESTRTPLWRTIRSLSPLWALAIYDVALLGGRMLGLAPIGLWPELACAIVTALLIAETWAGRDDADTPFRKTVAASALCWLGIQPIFVFMVSFLQHRMPLLDDAALGRVTSLSFLALNAVGSVAPLLLGRLARRFGAITVHAAALALMAAGLLAIWLAAVTPTVLVLLMAICGIGWGAVVSLPFAIMSGRVDPRRMGLFMGLFNLSVVLPQLVASLGIGSFVARATDKGLVFALAGACIAGSALLWLAARPTSILQKEFADVAVA